MYISLLDQQHGLKFGWRHVFTEQTWWGSESWRQPPVSIIKGRFFWWNSPRFFPLCWDWWLNCAIIESVLVLLTLLYKACRAHIYVHVYIGSISLEIVTSENRFAARTVPALMCVTKASATNALTDINDAPSPSLTPLTIKRRPE